MDKYSLMFCRICLQSTSIVYIAYLKLLTSQNLTDWKYLFQLKVKL